jgi:hypothetical protein
MPKMTEREPSSGMTQRQYNHTKREAIRASGMCVRHPDRPKNPRSRSHCDGCLDYFRDRKPSKYWRKAYIPRLTTVCIPGRPVFPGNQEALDYGRKMGLTIDRHHIIEKIASLGGVEKMMRLAPEVQRLLLGVSGRGL